MKRYLILYVLSLGMVFSSIGQDKFNTSEITWFGIDYSECYFMTRYDFPNTGDLKAKLNDWNDLILYERSKYIEKTLPGKKVNYEVDAVEERNRLVDIKSRVTEDLSLKDHLSKQRVEEIIKSLSVDESTEGTGLILIAGYYSKPDAIGEYYYVFFDCKSREIYAAEKITGKAKGFGFRNYWANTFYEVLKTIGKTY